MLVFPISTARFLASMVHSTDVASLPLDEKTCHICLVDYATSGEGAATASTCGHTFGRLCLERHITVDAEYARKCPKCRALWFEPAAKQIAILHQEVQRLAASASAVRDRYEHRREHLEALIAEKQSLHRACVAAQLVASVARAQNKASCAVYTLLGEYYQELESIGKEIIDHATAENAEPDTDSLDAKITFIVEAIKEIEEEVRLDAFN